MKCDMKIISINLSNLLMSKSIIFKRMKLAILKPKIVGLREKNDYKVEFFWIENSAKVRGKYSDYFKKRKIAS